MKEATNPYRSLTDRDRAGMARRCNDGCESPGDCDWLRLVRIESAVDLTSIQLCDFHRECVELAQERGKSLRPSEALRLHVAGWRANR